MFESLSELLDGVWASSSVRIEHQPPKLGVEGSNPSPPATEGDFFLLVENLLSTTFLGLFLLLIVWLVLCFLLQLCLCTLLCGSCAL
jgi:hypothetical protein